MTFHTRLSQLALGAAACIALAACGGGDGGSDTSSGTGSGGNSPITQLSGKAIDGYLSGAVVCFDDGHGACDPALPQTTTGSDGSYTLNVPSDVSHRVLLVQITPDTTDVTTGRHFAATFNLNAIIVSSQQNITPITSLVAAQVAAGKSEADAVATVEAIMGSSVDIQGDYLALGDQATADLAGQIVGTIQSNAVNGVVTPGMANNVYNAIVVAGDPTKVTTAAVLAQAGTPVDATQALAQPLHVIDDYMPAGIFSPVSVAMRDTYTLAGGQLSIVQETSIAQDGTWTPLAPIGNWDVQKQRALGVDLLDGSTGVFAMKADGSWTGFLTPDQLHPVFNLTSAGATLQGTDPNTGIGYQLAYRQADVGSQALTSVIPFDYTMNWQVAPKLTGTLAAGTTAYIGESAYTSDQVVLPVDADIVQLSIYNPGNVPGPVVCNPTCSPDTTTPQDHGEGLTSNGQALADPNVLGTIGQTYTSVQQVIGLQLAVGMGPQTSVSRLPGGKLILAADGTFTITGLSVYQGSYPPPAGQEPPTTTINVTGTWSVYSRNADVLVLEFPKGFNRPINSINSVTAALLEGAKFVIALHNGRLKSGFLIPAGTTSYTAQFPDATAQQIANSLIAVGAQQGL